jgi:hypothetical protein
MRTDGRNPGADRKPACVEFDKSGERLWYNEFTERAEQMGDKLSITAGDHPSQVAGISYCSDRQGMVVFIKSGASSVERLLREEAAAYPEFTFEFQYVPRSLDEMTQLTSKVVSAGLAEQGLQGIGPDPYTGGVTIEVLVSAGTEAPEEATAKAEAAVKAIIGEDVPVATTTATSEFVSSYNRYDDDAQPHYMGAAICSSSGSCTVSASGRCSSGVPITVNGTKTMLTAGHCTASRFYNNGAYIGSQYTTSYPGNAGIYGDWKLVYQHSYALKTYAGGLYDTTTLNINGANWGVRAIGSGICTSGSTTGQACRFFVTATGATRTVSGVTTGRLTIMRHDSSGGSGSDTNGFRPGDSGGPCYYANGTGNVAVAGIVTGLSADHYTYLCTQLQGVRAWDSGAALG